MHLSTYRMKTIIAEARDALLIQEDTRLDLVDILTGMHLSIDPHLEDAAKLWHEIREGHGYPDDGSSDERIRNLESKE